MAYDLVIRRGLVATASDAIVADLGIRGGRIATIDQGLPKTGQEIDARGLVLMPGGVDVHTHLDLDLGGARTADDFDSGTAAAACGGVTTICDYAWQTKGNTLAGTINPQETLNAHTMTIFLCAPSDHPRNRLRSDLTRKAFMLEGLNTDFIEARGQTRLAHLWTTIMFGDYMAYYLAMGYGVDPTPIQALVDFKHAMAEAK